MIKFAIFLITLLIIGCGPMKAETKEANNPPAKPSSVDLFTDSATGKTHLDIKKKKETELRGINANYNKKLEDALGE